MKCGLGVVDMAYYNVIPEVLVRPTRAGPATEPSAGLVRNRYKAGTSGLGSATPKRRHV